MSLHEKFNDLEFASSIDSDQPGNRPHCIESYLCTRWTAKTQAKPNSLDLSTSAQKLFMIY